MKKYLLNISLGLFGLLAFTACMDDTDAPTLPAAGEAVVTSPTSVGKVNASILDVKARYCASSEGADNSRNSSNFFTKVRDSICIEGVVVANDEGGNLYQTVMIRNIDAAAGTDQCIKLTIKNTCLYPYFKLGQRLRVQLKDLYVGCYSKVPTVGEPIWSSQGNLNLGPMLFERCRTNIQLIGKPNLSAPELVPLVPTVDWLRASANKTYENTPLLATVTGKIKEVQGTAAETADKGDVTGETEQLPKIFAPDALHDLGFGVDRTIQFEGSTTSVSLRTSTQNAVSFLPIPSDSRSYTGILSYYSSWQMQVRGTNDIFPAIEQ